MESTQELASRWKRFGGALIDGLITLAVTLPVMAITGVLKQTQQGHPMTIGQRVFFFIFSIAVFLVIQGYLLAKHGQTVGKKLVGSRIARITDGQIFSIGPLLGLRYLPLWVIYQIPFVGVIFSLADVLFIFRKDKRCIHDLIAGSQVVNA